jgi:hypothetical protein
MKNTSGQKAEIAETVYEQMLRTLKQEFKDIDREKFHHAAYLLKLDIKRVQGLVDFPEQVAA